MITAVEATYREHLAEGPQCLLDALDYILPLGSTNDDEVTALARELCYLPALYEDRTADAFAASREDMMDHSLRQVPLVLAIFNDGNIRDRLPQRVNLRLLAQCGLVFDVGTAFVPKEALASVHCMGAKGSKFFEEHPRFSYGMAKARGIDTPARQMLACFPGRHHMIQARNRFGLEWSEMDHHLVDTKRVDQEVALLKVIDYFDDCIDRPNDSGLPFEARVAAPLQKFIDTAPVMLFETLGIKLGDKPSKHGFDPMLPILIAKKIQEVVMNDEAINDLYRSLDHEMVPA